MSVPADAIEDAILSILEADAAFSAIAHFFGGVLIRVPDSWLPLCEVHIFDYELNRQLSGNVDIVDYRGVITFDHALADAMTTAGTISTSSSARVVRNWVWQARKVLHKPANLKLGDLSGDDWAVRYVEVARDATFGINARTERENDYQYSGRVPILVQTQESTS